MTKGMPKGKRFELRVAKLLSEWSGLDLRRTPMSGAWASGTGDLIPAVGELDFPFVVECKHEEGWEFDHLLNGKGLFLGWIEQAVRQAQHKTELTGVLHWPLLVFTRNRRAIYIMFPTDIIGQSIITTHISLAHGKFVVGEANSILSSLDYQRLLKYIRLTRIRRQNYERQQIKEGT
jgi:hypothetical protein